MNTVQNAPGDEAALAGCFEDYALLRYYEKSVTESEAHMIEQHLVACETCLGVLAAMERNSHRPMSETAKMEVTQAFRLTPGEQVAKILGYIEAESRHAQKGEMSILVVLQHMWQKAKALVSSIPHRMMAILWQDKPAWRFGYAMMALFVIAGGAFWGTQYYKKGYRVGKAERLVEEHYQVSVPDQEPRLSGDYAPTGLGTLMGSSEKKQPYLAQAFKLTEDAIANGYDDPKAKQLLAQIYILNGQYTQADSILQQLKQGSPTLPAALNDLGVIHFRRKDWKMAAQFFAAAIQADPQIKEARYNLALAKIEMGEAAEVIAILDDYIKLETVDGWKDAARKLKRELQ